MIKKIVLSFFIVLIFVFSFLLITLKVISSKFNQPLLYFPSLIVTNQTYHPQVPQNFLILGLDPRNDSLEKTEVTDTIMMVNLKPNLNINLISLPRDLWSYPLNAKINQIYPLSFNQKNKFKFIQDNFTQITSVPIQRTFIFTTANLQQLVNLIGGVDVYLESGFTDKQYPNPEYIKNPTPKTPIYITISFPQGWNHLDSNNISPFVRSRHNADTAVGGGTDIGRAKRQQLVIDSIVSKFRHLPLKHKAALLPKLYNFWHQDVKTNFTDLDMISVLKYISSGNNLNLKINKIEIPTGENPKTDILYHPKKFINPQWVFLPQDKDYQSLHQFIRSQFAILDY